MSTTHAAAEPGVGRYEMFINGEFVSSGTNSKTSPVINPANEEVIAEIPNGTPADVSAAVLAAETAHRSWSRLSAITRAGYLREIAQAVRANSDRLAQVISQERGKVLPLAQVENLKGLVNGIGNSRRNSDKVALLFRGTPA